MHFFNIFGKRISEKNKIQWYNPSVIINYCESENASTGTSMNDGDLAKSSNDLDITKKYSICGFNAIFYCGYIAYMVIFKC